MTQPPEPHEVPRTAADRLILLKDVQSDLQSLIEDHRDAGLHVNAMLPELSDFSWDAHGSRLTAHARSGACRVNLYLSGVHDGRAMVPLGVADITGTCKDCRRRRVCAHTLAAVKRLAAILENRASPLREQLFRQADGEAWRGALRLVDQFLANVPQESEAESQPANTRIVWRAEFAIQEFTGGLQSVSFGITPYEQKLGKGGRWSKGRRLSIDSLEVDEESLHDVDRRIVRKVEQQLYSSSARYGYGFAARGGGVEPYDILEELIGHPLVFWADRPEVPVEVTRGQFGIAVEERPGGWIVRPAFDGQIRPHEGIWAESGGRFVKPLWIDRSRDRIVLCPADSAVVTLVAKLAAIGEPIPPAGQAALLEKLALLQSRVPIILPDRLCGGTEAADPRIVLRLTPEPPDAVRAELVVIPVAGGAAYVPGSGPETISVLQGGKQLRYQRFLPDERRRGGEIAEQLRLSIHPALRPFCWHLPTLDDCLDLLAALADQPIDDLQVQWAAGAERSVSRTVQPAALRVQIQAQQDWFGLSGTVEIEGQAIELARILAAMKQGSRYLEVAPQQFVRLAQTLRQSLEAIADASYETKSGQRELDITAAPVLEQLCDQSVELRACLAWEDSLRRLHAAQELTPEPPVTLQAELRDYQLDGYRWLRRLAAWGMGGCLADDMGLGKTVQTLSALIDRASEGPALVIAPTSVGFNWVREIERFAPTLRPILYRETDREDVLTNLQPGDVLIASYGLLLRDVGKLAKIAWSTLVLDEAQKIKNAVTKSAQAVRKIEAGWRLALTGTPLENHLGELWSIFRAVCPGLLGSWERFRAKFAEPIERQNDPRARRALSRLIRPFILRRTKSEVLEELPQRTEIIRTAEMTAAERQRYDAARLAALADLAEAGSPRSAAGRDRRFEVLAALTRLRQLACHPRLVDPEWPGGSAKLEAFMEIVLELRESGHRALVFSQFVQHLSLLRGALDAAGVSYQYLDGQTSPRDRELRVDAFQQGEGDLFLISLKAGGTGLNLTAADFVIHMDPWWNPAVEDQATDRAHRIGQTRPVTVYRLVAKDTIEEQILALHASKRNLVADLLAGADQSGKLSTQELIALIRGQVAQEELLPI